MTYKNYVSDFTKRLRAEFLPVLLEEYGRSILISKKIEFGTNPHVI